MFINAIVLAIRQITRNYMRAFLTMLGVIIGVCAVIVMINIGTGTQLKIKENIESLGSNVLMIHAPPHLNPNGTSRSRFFTMQEVEAISDRLASVKAISPTVSSSVIASYRNKNIQSSITGITDGYFTALNWQLSEGRLIDNREYLSGANVCVIGSSIKEHLFDTPNVIGSRIRLNKQICTVVGVLASKGQGAGYDQDSIILSPIKYVTRSIAPTKSLYNIHMIMVALYDDVDYQLASTQITTILRHIRNIPDTAPNTFEIRSTKELQETVTQSVKSMTIFIGAVAGVSLIVGGIGIMNIMLVSVTERTREILQFLIESATISAIGGFIGIFFSIIFTFLLSLKMDIPFIFNIHISIFAVLFSCFIGIIFGYLPARKASRLNPIDALRHE